MNNALPYRSFTLRRNIPILIGAFLCLYFGYHIIQGHRSLPALVAVQHDVVEKNAELVILKSKREALERKVVMLRPGSLNKDFLEERVRFMLGYRHPDEWFVSGSGLR
ncbi:MAG: septum formation initiator family protein [Alphaproteobacteria bacterium]|nr:septum formation initiator family protein [Alphaproteobacteria bacterium]MCD8520372.1 septum formation initiator family protein [Alphaproteobacteria bacterium]MCD8526299.1 septum formation initiator family protein [Alphaproteobacteria bacterium]MCD8570060.1 septum formation initiator family protein [Alphaproteobacteria bacterium]